MRKVTKNRGGGGGGGGGGEYLKKRMGMRKGLVQKFRALCEILAGAKFSALCEILHSRLPSLQ